MTRPKKEEYQRDAGPNTLIVHPSPRHRPECVFGPWDISGCQNTSWDKDHTLRNWRFYGSWPWETCLRWCGFGPWDFSDVKTHLQRRITPEKLSLLRIRLQATVTVDVALNLEISQGFKTRFEPKLEKSRTLSLPLHLEKTLSYLEKIREIMETPWGNTNLETPWEKNKNPLSTEIRPWESLERPWGFFSTFSSFSTFWGSDLGADIAAPRSDPKKVEKLEKVEKNSQGRSLLSQGLIFLKVGLCRQGIFIFVSRSGSVSVFSRCLLVFQGFLKVDRQTQGARFLKVSAQSVFWHLEKGLRNLKV